LQPPKVDRFTDPDTNRVIERTAPPPKIPDYIAQAMSARAKILGSRPMAQVPAAPTVLGSATPPRVGAATPPRVGVATTPGAVAATTPGAVAATTPGAVAATTPRAEAAAPTNLYDLAKTGTGVFNLIPATAAKVPFIGGMVDPVYSQSVAEIRLAVSRIVKALQETTRMSNAEREDVQASLDLLPKPIDRPKDYRNRLVAVDNILERIEATTINTLNSEEVGSKNRQEAQLKLIEVRGIRAMLGLPVKVYTSKQVEQLPPNTEFYYVPEKRFDFRLPR
jgi:hypothetical protein